MHDGSSPDPPTTLAIRSACRLFRDALALWLAGHADFRVAGKVGTDGDLLDLCRLRPPDLVVFDAAGATLYPLGHLRDHVSPARIVVLYEPLSSPWLATARGQGAALVPYSHGLHALLAVLRRVADEQRAAGARPPGRDRLTDEECEIISLIAAGKPAHRIADLLAVTPGSLESAKRRIFQKLRVFSQNQATVRAVALGLVEPAGPPGTGTRQPEIEGRFPELTPREYDILHSIAMGHTVRQTARLLDIAAKTVENTQARLFLKLGARQPGGCDRRGPRPRPARPGARHAGRTADPPGVRRRSSSIDRGDHRGPRSAPGTPYCAGLEAR